MHEVVAIMAKIDSIALLGMPGNEAVELELAVDLDFSLIAVWPSHANPHEQHSRAKASRWQLYRRSPRSLDKEFENYALVAGGGTVLA